MIKIAIIDDHKIVIEGIESLLQNESDISVVANSTNGEFAKGIIKANDVDILILDIEMPNMNGVEVAKEVLGIRPNTKILILSMSKEYKFIKSLNEIGCYGYILKDNGFEELVIAIREIHNGTRFYGTEIKDAILEGQREEAQKQLDSSNSLTSRELDVLRELSTGSSSLEIADALFIGVATVHSHKRNLKSKLAVSSSTALVAYAFKNRLI